jgi:hypothetical protein
MAALMLDATSAASMSLSVSGPEPDDDVLLAEPGV